MVGQIVGACKCTSSAVSLAAGPTDLGHVNTSVSIDPIVS